MWDKYADWVFRRARWVLTATSVIFVGLAVLGAGAFGALKTGGFDDPRAESIRARDAINSAMGGELNLVLLVTARTGTVDSPAPATAGDQLATALAAEPDVGAVISYWATGAPALRSTDATEALVLARVNGDSAHQAERTKELIDTYTGGAGAISVRAGGEAAAYVDVPAEVAKSLAIAEAIAVPLTLLLLLLAFGSAVAASLPLAIGAIAIFGTFAELAVLGRITDVSVFAVNLTTALGLGLGIDYALLLVGRFREQLATGQDVRGATIATVRTAGRTIVFSAATVAAALAALLAFPLFFLRSFAYAGIGVVVIAAVAALAVVPALLAVLGPRINAGRLPWPRTVRGAESPGWGRLAGIVMRRPALTALPVLAVLLFVASPLLTISFGTPDPGVLSSRAQSRQVSEAIATRFPGGGASTLDVVIAGPLGAPILADYAAALSRLDGVAQVATSTGVYVRGGIDPASRPDPSLAAATAQRLSVVSTLLPKSDAAQDLVRAVRAVPAPGGVEVLIGGDDARLVDTKQAIGDRLGLAVALIVVTTFVLLFLFTGSVIQPLRALLVNALSLAATVGVLTWIFQDGHLASLLGFTPRPMDTSMTVLLFCITFGLSMDYEVFLTSRIKELYDQGAGVTGAVTQGLARTGRIVSTAAGLLAVSFFAFATSSVSFLQMFGIGAGLAILIDATLIRGVLVPAMLRILGPAAWYAPRALRRVQARLALSES